MYKAVSITTGILLVSGCAVVGVMESSDPRQKQANAEAMLEQNRPRAAELLIEQSLQLCRRSGQALCFADGYRAYGRFLMSSTLDGQWKTDFEQNGFREPQVSYANRYDKALEYFQRSRALYVQEGRFDGASNVSLQRGFIYEMQADTSSACNAYDQSQQDQAQNQSLKPQAKVTLPERYESFAQYIDQQKRRAGCAPEG
ncbi:hypothetical protein GV819_14070 [Pseudomonas sp. Fl5BN2]|uniref:hypothetical protein n=1 Tax=Pseudomonas sp. Fl5BN2 TaxID=2697652 RepID=UPI0013768BD4|nr:hypothetical protein [Pseudomonas sp. Fl5BN2]NBF03416.1 hypothetical protein [Pseudomonas sp. Fl5BN2]